MKIVLIITTLVTVLAIGLFGINNSSSNNSNIIDEAFAQMDLENFTMIGNDTGGMIMNATIAYVAQHGSEIGKEYRKMGET